MTEHIPLQGFQMSPQQQRIWTQQKGHAKFYAQCILLIEGNLDRERLNRAIQACVARHEILRTSFQHSPMLEIPWQVIHEEVKVLQEDRDISNLEENEQERVLRQLALERRNLPFDIENGPPIRVTFVTMAASRHALLIDIAALCIDSSTFIYIEEELARFYMAPEQSEDLLEPPLQYADFATWQIETLDQEAPVSAREFWQRSIQQPGQLHPELPLQLMADAPANSALSSYSYTVEQELVVQARAFADQHHVSMESIFLACWSILLWRLNSVTDLEAGLIAQGRAVADGQTLLGSVARCLPLHLHIDERMDVPQIIQDIHAQLLEVREWEIYFDPQYKQLAFPAHDGEPRMSVAFEYSEWPTYQVDGLTFKVIDQSVCTERFDIKLTCSVKDQALTITMDYHPELYAAEIIAYSASHYLTLLQSMLCDPSTALARLNILCDADRKFLQDINKTEVAYPADRCIYHLFQEQARRTPERLAVVYENERITYAELDMQANRLAHFLQRQGAQPDQPIALLSEKSVGMVVALLAILKAGSSYVPLNPEHSTGRLALQLGDIQAPIILTQQRYRQHLSSYNGLIFCLDADWELVAGEPETEPVTTVSLEQLAYVIYTSGSTGMPKGVMITHANLLNYVYAMGNKLTLWEKVAKPQIHFAHVSTLEADLGNTVIFLSLVSGGCLHLISQERATDSQLFARYIAAQPIDVMKITPSHLTALLATQEGPAILPTTYLVLGGEALSFSLVNRIAKLGGKCKVINHYGPTETTIGSVVYDLSELKHTQVYQTATAPIGRSLENVELSVLDQELQMVPIGVPGILYIGGACLARGYLHQPAQTAERFIPNPFNKGKHARLYNTGDVVRYLPDGNIEFLQRVDRQVKIRGFRVELAEVEAAIRQYSEVSAVATTIKEDVQGNKQLLAYITLTAPQPNEVILDDLQRHLRENLPDYMLPAMVSVLERFPLTPNGKLDYRALPLPDQTLAIRRRSYIAPQTPSEETVVTLMAQLLGLEQVSVDESFFELGGHSLLATQLIARLREVFQLELPVRLLFDKPTAAELSLAILEYELEQEDSEELVKILQEIQEIGE
jgi:amino acid adenylation domain-containing protein